MLVGAAMKRALPLAVLILLGFVSLFLAAKDRGPRGPWVAPPNQREAEKEPEPASDNKKDAEPSVAGAKAPTSATRPQFDLMEDGSTVPPLAEDAPKRVRLAVLVVGFDGTQGFSIPGFSERHRTKDEALELARSVHQLAQTDLKKALEKADRGSRDDIGFLPRGILERRIEHQVFGLRKGDFAPEPLETPRGYWVVKRLE